MEDTASIWSRPGYLVRRLHQISVAIFLEEMRELELTPMQFGVLSVVNSTPGIDQSALGASLGLDQANIADVVRRLLKAQLITREPSTRDRRAKNVFITPHGKALLRKALPHLKRAQERLLEPLPRAEQEHLLRLLTDLVLANNSLGRTRLRLP